MLKAEELHQQEQKTYMEHMQETIVTAKEQEQHQQEHQIWDWTEFKWESARSKNHPRSPVRGAEAKLLF